MRAYTLAHNLMDTQFLTKWPKKTTHWRKGSNFLFYFWIYNLITPFSLPFLPHEPFHTPFPALLQFMASFLTNCYCIHICLYISISKGNLLVYNATSVDVSRTDWCQTSSWCHLPWGRSANLSLAFFSCPQFLCGVQACKPLPPILACLLMSFSFSSCLGNPVDDIW